MHSKNDPVFSFVVIMSAHCYAIIISLGMLGIYQIYQILFHYHFHLLGTILFISFAIYFKHILHNAQK